MCPDLDYLSAAPIKALDFLLCTTTTWSFYFKKTIVCLCVCVLFVLKVQTHKSNWKQTLITWSGWEDILFTNNLVLTHIWGEGNTKREREKKERKSEGEWKTKKTFVPGHNPPRGLRILSSLRIYSLQAPECITKLEGAQQYLHNNCKLA